MVLASVLLALSVAAPAGAAQPDPAVFDAILGERARAGGFDYRGATGQDKKRLAAYLSNLADAKPGEMAEEEREAFYINAYNAMAIQVVLERYPVQSILDIDGAFKAIRKKVGGEMLTLDDIENRLRDTKDARIHFAIVCASRSCPPLRSTAYRAAGLSAALDSQGRAFVGDATKNILDRAKERLALSKIFDWNRKEFERDGGTIPKYVSRFVEEAGLRSWVATYPGGPEFLEYDWALNQP